VKKNNKNRGRPKSESSTVTDLVLLLFSMT